MYSVQNNETGEVDYLPLPSMVMPLPLSSGNVDVETGEVDFRPTTNSPTTTIEHQHYDEETGEPQCCKVRIRYVKHDHFHIPRRFFRGSACEQFQNEVSGKYQDVIQPSVVSIYPKAELNAAKDESKKRKQKYMHDDYINMECVQNEIILGHKKDNYRMFLIPTLFFFNVYLAMLVGVLESLLHMWAHRKNDLNMDKQIYFRSPLHVLTSQFCGRCRSESEMDIKIFDMLNKQMRKTRAARTLKDVSKVIG